VWSCVDEGEEDIEKILASIVAKEAEKTAIVMHDVVDPPVRANGSIVRVGDEMVLFGGSSLHVLLCTLVACWFCDDDAARCRHAAASLTIRRWVLGRRVL
jgi:hypothetical protein